MLFRSLNIQSEIDDIKLQMEERKGEYQTLKDKVEKIKLKENELKSELDKEKEQYINLNAELKSVQKDIDLYDSGKCPTCGTDFDSDHFHNLKDVLLEKKRSTESIKIEIENNIKGIRDKQTKLQTIADTTNRSFNDITYLLKNYKAQIDKLQLQKDRESGQSNTNVSEFENTILELESKMEVSAEYQTICKEKESYYKELKIGRAHV